MAFPGDGGYLVMKSSPWTPPAAPCEVDGAGRGVPADTIHQRAPDRPAARGRRAAGAGRLPGRLDQETVGGKDPLVQLALLLAATERITFGTGIANIWARAPQTAHAAAALLAQAYPGRLFSG